MKRAKKEGLRGMFYYDMDAVSYKPTNFLGKVVEKLGVKNDTALADVLGVDHTMFYHIRARRLRITPCLMLRIHDLTGWTIAEMRQMSGIPSTQDMESLIYGTKVQG